MANLFGKAKMPEVAAPQPMPDEKSLDEERIRRMALERQASGRESTRLAQGGNRETLGA